MKDKKLLLVDDVELFLAMEKSILSRRAFEIHTAQSGQEALEKARSVQPDMILLDLNMPDMNGDEVCSVLKSDPETSDIPIIIVTSEKETGALERCVDAGADKFFFKPFHGESLLAAVEELMVVSQRRHPRVPVKLDCTVCVGEVDLATSLHVLSEGGAFIELSIPPATGSELDLTFQLPGSDHAIKAGAKVRWSASIRQHGPLGVGLEFIDIEGADQEAIAVFVDGELRSQKKKQIGSVNIE